MAFGPALGRQIQILLRLFASRFAIRNTSHACRSQTNNSNPPGSIPNQLVITEFPQSVLEKIGSYVYLLRDPRNNEVFYVGKGVGNRVFHHVSEAIEMPTSTDKLDRIREIRGNNLEVDYRLVRHGLTEKEAFEVEAALIDFVGLAHLSNAVVGQRSSERGLMSVADVIGFYGSSPAQITEAAMLITVNRLYDRGMPADVLYESTRGKWVVGERRNQAKYAFAVFRGIIREVYRIDSWEVATEDDDPEIRKDWVSERNVDFQISGRRRWRFSGRVAHELSHYIGQTAENYIRRGAQNPIKYVNC